MRLMLTTALVVSLAAAGGLASPQAASAADVTFPSNAAVSPALRDLPDAPLSQSPQDLKQHPAPLVAPAFSAGPSRDTGATLQTKASSPLAAQTSKAAFSGIGENNYIPGDPNIAVGQAYIVQVVNSEIAVFDKLGNLVNGPKRLGALWSGLGGNCATQNAGDPIVQYDNLAPDGLNDGGTGRWVITQLGSTSSPYSECVAVSKTSDPTGAYTLYSYTVVNSRDLNDYPKFGVWPTASNSAYLASYNLFQNGARFVGAALCAYDRAKMLAGNQSPGQICKTVANPSFLPSDLDGATPPADGTPGYFLDFDTTSSLRLYQLSPNFSAGTASLTGPTEIAVTPFSEACNGGSCVPQPLTSRQLDSLGDRLMYRLAYRMLGGSGGTPTMVVNHSAAANSTVGVRWYQLQATNGVFGLVQSGTYVPDSNYRWMGSMAMDQLGDIAVGYSESSGSVYPSIVYTGRVPTDPAGTLEAEAVMQPGAGSQTGYTRWGDYTAMRIDPSDDCTFWYTNEYYTQTSSFVWSTAIGSFKFPSCP
jgi:hypothetical protein